jgi:hypothetical protein
VTALLIYSGTVCFNSSFLSLQEKIAKPIRY